MALILEQPEDSTPNSSIMFLCGRGPVRRASKWDLRAESYPSPPSVTLRLPDRRRIKPTNPTEATKSHHRLELHGSPVCTAGTTIVEPVDDEGCEIDVVEGEDG